MGCTNSKESQSRLQTISMVQCRHEGIGMLKVKVKHMKEVKRVEDFNQGNIEFLQLDFMNQDFITALSYDQINKQTLYPKESQFSFIVNVMDTRKCLQLNIYEQHSKQTKVLFKTASGREILEDTLFTQNNSNQPSKKSCNMCLASQNNGQKVGWVRVQLQFTPRKYDILTIRVDSVTLRSQLTRERRIYVNIKIGGQQFQSQSFLQNYNLLPTWQNAIASFIIPEQLSYGRLSVYEKDDIRDADYLVGELKFNLKVILESYELQTFTETITLKDKVTGSVNLQFLKTKDKMPVIHKIERPKRIKYYQQQKLQLLEKNHNGFYGANYVSKKSSQATLCSQTKSFDIISYHRLNQKLLELKENCVGKEIGMGMESYRSGKEMESDRSGEKMERNQFYFDSQKVQEEIIKGTCKYVVQNVRIEKIFSDHQLNLQYLHIPQTSSILIEKHPSSQLQNHTPPKTTKQQSINHSPSFNSNEQYSSLDLSCCSKINKKSTKDNIINLQKIDKSIIRFDSLPDDMSSKSFGVVGSLDGQQKKGERQLHQTAYLRNRSVIKMSVQRNQNQKQKQNQLIFDKNLMPKHKSLISQQTQRRKFKKNNPLEQKCGKIQFQRYQKPAEKYYEFPKQNCINYTDFEIKISTIIAKKTIPTSS